jgi:serine/threonine protein kinase
MTTAKEKPLFSPDFNRRYEIIRFLGEGGMGIVFLARQRRLEREVAVKLLKSVKDTDLARFQREAQLLARLDHPRIVRILEMDTDSHQMYIVMEYVRGESLSERLRRGPFTLSQALELLGRVAEALAHAHSQNVIHRDIKPSNVFLTPEDDIRLADFGLARHTEAGTTVTADGILAGTPAYIAPEQVMGAKATTASDQYSLGVMAFEVVCGEPPFKGETIADLLTARLSGQFTPPRDLVMNLPESVEQLILRAMATAPAQRYPNVGEFRDRALALAQQVAPEMTTRSLSVPVAAASPGAVRTMDWQDHPTRATPESPQGQDAKEVVTNAAPETREDATIGVVASPLNPPDTVATPAPLPAPSAAGSGVTRRPPTSRSGARRTAQVPVPTPAQRLSREVPVVTPKRHFPRTLTVAAGILAFALVAGSLAIRFLRGRSTSANSDGSRSSPSIVVEIDPAHPFEVFENSLNVRIRSDRPVRLKASIGSADLLVNDTEAPSVRRIPVSVDQVWQRFAVAITVDNTGQAVQVLQHSGLRSEFNRTLLPDDDLKRSIAPEEWLRRSKTAEKDVGESVAIRTRIRALLEQHRARYRLFLQTAHYILDSPHRTLAEKKWTYDTLTPLRMLDRLAVCHTPDAPLLDADLALGKVFGLGNTSGSWQVRELACFEPSPPIDLLHVSDTKGVADTVAGNDLVNPLVEATGVGRTIPTQTRATGTLVSGHPAVEAGDTALELVITNDKPSNLIWVEVAGWKLLFNVDSVLPSTVKLHIHGTDRRLVTASTPVVIWRECLLESDRARVTEFRRMRLLWRPPVKAR